MDSSLSVQQKFVDGVKESTKTMQSKLERLNSEFQAREGHLLDRIKALEERTNRIDTLVVSSGLVGAVDVKKERLNTVSVFFATGSARVSDDGGTQVANILRVLNNNPGSKLQITPFTDRRGLAVINSRLRQRRQKAIFEILKNYGVNPNLVVFEKWPGTYSTSNDLDRRVDLKIVP